MLSTVEMLQKNEHMKQEIVHGQVNMHVNHKSDRSQNRLQGVHDKWSGVEYKWTSCM